MKAITPLRLLSLPVLALAVLPSCKKNTEARMDPEWWRLEADRVELVQEIKLQKLRVGEEDILREHAALKTRMIKNEALLASLRESAGSLRSEVADMAAALVAERENWIASTRAAAVGRNFETFTGSSGRIYTDVTVTRVTDVGIEFRHSDGSGRLLATDMSPDLHADFGLDTGAALVAMEREKASAAAYETYIADRMVEVDAERKEEERINAERETERVVASARARSESYSARLAAKEESSPLRAGPRAFGSRGGSVWYPSYSRYSRYSRNNYYYPNYCSPVVSGGGIFTRGFAVSVGGGGCGYTPRVTPVFSGGACNPSTTTIYR